MLLHIHKYQVSRIHEPIGGLGPVLVNHDVDVWSAAVVVTGVDGGHLHDAVRVRIPPPAKEGLRAVEIVGFVPTVEAGCVG